MTHITDQPHISCSVKYLPD